MRCSALANAGRKASTLIFAVHTAMAPDLAPSQSALGASTEAPSLSSASAWARGDECLTGPATD